MKDPVPIDYLDKMPDKQKDLKMQCEQAAEDLLKNEKMFKKDADGEDIELDLTRFKVIRSRPYVRKSNLIVDKAINYCWEMVMRFNKFDVCITILRRSYLPPFADTYQDVIVSSRYELEDEEVDQEYEDSGSDKPKDDEKIKFET